MEPFFAAVSARINGNLMFIYDKSHAIFFFISDGAIRTWDCVGDNIGKLTRVCHEHDGWINCFLYWFASVFFSNCYLQIISKKNFIYISLTVLETGVYTGALPCLN